MDSFWRIVLWQQFGAAIDMLENAVLACPSTLWQGRLWGDPSQPPGFAEFWYVTYHTLFWLDLYLTGSPESFAPPAPFTLTELEPAGALPERPYTKEELRAYLAATRRKCHATLAALTDERAHQAIEHPWMGGKPIGFFELQLYNMRHVQEHAAQLSLFLGQHAIPDEALGWVPRAKDESGSQ